MAERPNFTAVLALLCAIAFWPAGIVLGYQARREAERIGNSTSLAVTAIVVAIVVGVISSAAIGLRAAIEPQAIRRRYSCTSSISVPNEVLGCTKATVVPREPGRGASSITRPPASLIACRATPQSSTR